MTTNMYRVGDYVYFETSSSSPYQIRRIEELIKTPAGNVEAKVMCYYRRRDIPSHLLAVASLKHHSAFDDDPDVEDVDPTLGLSQSNHAPHTRLLGSLPTQLSSSRSSNSSSQSSSAPSTFTSTTTTTTAAAGTPLPSSVAVSASGALNKPVPVTANNANSSFPPYSDFNIGSSTANGTCGSAVASANNSGNIKSTAGANTASDRVVSAPKKFSPVSDERSSLSEDERHQLGHRELFLSRQIETLPATHIRGKCTVTLLNETESLASYMAKEDTFFYSLVYDPLAKTLLADKGEIRIGSNYQAEVSKLLKEGEGDGRVMSDLETLVWTPDHGLTDRQIDQFLVVARSVGTFARALDCSSSVKQPSLHMSAAAASRDVTLFEAMSLLHEQNYDLSKALSCLVPGSGPLLCRDQMEEWAASEANLFEEALDKYGKDFNDIRQDFLPWKTLKNIIEYYYMWKTTDRYVQQKRVKAVEAESKLKQVYIPNYNKTNPAALSNGSTIVKPLGLLNGSTAATAASQGFSCEGCSVTTSSQWYSWGPAQKPGKLCSDCWLYWKKLGGLKKASRSAKEEEEAGMRPVVKTRNAFYLHSSPALRVMRRLARDALKRRRAARNPTTPINGAQVRHESLIRLEGRTLESLIPWLQQIKSSGRGAGSSTLKDVTLKLGQLDTYCPSWLVIAPALVSKRRPQPVQPASVTPFSATVTSAPDVAPYTKDSHAAPHQQLLKRKPYQETNGIDGAPPAKRSKESSDPPLDPYRLSQLGLNPPPGLTVTPIGMNGGTPPPPPLVSSSSLPSPRLTTITTTATTTTTTTTSTPPPPYHSSHITTTSPVPVPPPATAAASSTRVVSQLQHAGAGRTKMASMTRMSGRPRIISWMDAPDDVYFYSTAAIKTQRRTLTITELRRAARRPWRRLLQLPLSLQQQQLQQMVHAAQVVAPAAAKSATAVPGPLPPSD